MLVLKSHGLPAVRLAFSPDGGRLAVSAPRLSLRMYDTRSGDLLWLLPPQPQEGGDGSPCFSPDGRFVVRQWRPDDVLDAATGKSVGPLPAEEAPGGPRWPTFVPLSPGVVQRQVSPDGRWATDGRRHRIEDRQTGEDLNLLQRFGRDEKGKETVPLWALAPFAFHPTEPLLAGGLATRLHLLRLPGLEIVATLNQAPKHFQGAAFTPDGRQLLTVSNAATVRVWDTATWAEARAYAWKVGPLKCVAVAPDGLRAACGGDGGRVVVWDLDG